MKSRRLSAFKKWNRQRPPDSNATCSEDGLRLSFAVTRTPSRNEADKIHWHDIKRLRLRYEQEVLVAVNSFRSSWSQWPADQKRLLRLERHCRGKLDEDNLTGGAKQLQDALVNVGLLVDDKPGCLSVSPPVQVWSVGDVPRTVVFLELLTETSPAPRKAKSTGRVRGRGRSRGGRKTSGTGGVRSGS